MWTTFYEGKEVEMEDIIQCFLDFPQFDTDFNILESKGVIKHTSFDRYEWTKSETSLAEYFKWIGSETGRIEGGFWSQVEKVFKIDRRKLSRLASKNANPFKPEESRDIKKIKKIVLEYREALEHQAQQYQEDKNKYEAIKKIFISDIDDDIEKIRDVLKRIKIILI